MNCTTCQSDFAITSDDQAFYATNQVPAPINCPDCRQQKRLAWRNERIMYKRKCDGTGVDMLSVYSSDKTFPVYEPSHWYSDQWDAMDYGKKYDFTRPFFEQFKELLNNVPQLARSVVNNQNCDYINQAGWCKDCYLIFEADFNEHCMYSSFIYDSKSCVDCLGVNKSELCYQCVDCKNCYNLKYSQDCDNCSDSWFLKNCIGCKSCFGSVNLRNKEYYFLNEKCTKEEYEAKLAALNLQTNEGIETLQKSFNEFIKKFPQKYLQGIQNENPTGNYLFNTKNCNNCFDLSDSQDCKYVTNSRNMRNCYDITVFGSQDGAEFSVDCHEIGGGVRNIYYSEQIWGGCNDIYYSKLCVQNSNNLFGCVGLRHKSYCILNKQYSQEEYEELKAKIIEHMKSTGEWGQFFPASISLLSYNETTANDYYPLTKEEALSKGFKWRDEDEKPRTVAVDALTCADTGAQFKLTPSEISWLERMKLPAPTRCPEQRHKLRFALRTKRKLYDRNCQKCNVDFKTAFSPKRPEAIYCEKCYLESTE